ncbi:hypothetical protein LK994_13780 [Ferruginibacter lapsinanis]|uniref:hypothetical protein n=1 Tax=Ferruginibacter lapsinanis TaxID=563172 RepID=UPI001E3C994D|nr:hypothetical protein [Ferruginibacter lapsinanis]UEG49707.1 hypothetical protein LK994_13780 [Ferruginibacter lapsinanis]
MSYSFDIVDQKVNETEFFLRKMIEAKSNWFEFSCYLTAFLSSSRAITLALQRFKFISGFDEWYNPKQAALKSDPLAKFILEVRNDNVHGGPNPVVGGSFYRGESEYRFKDQDKLEYKDIVSCCRVHFINLLEIVYDCYLVLGIHVDPQQYYTREHFTTMGLTIDDAELEIWGWIMDSYIEDGFDEDDRWHELRSKVGECKINHLFNGYLGKVTPQPVIPDRIADFDFTDEEKGWVYIPPGFETIEDYINSLDKKVDRT